MKKISTALLFILGSTSAMTHQVQSESTMCEFGTIKKHFACQYPNCGKRFTTKSCCYVHELSHTDAPRGTCMFPGCQACFKKAACLARHIRTHTGEKPYTCKICGKCFADAGNCATHKLIHTQEKPYACNYPNCTSSYTQFHPLKKHIKLKHPDFFEQWLKQWCARKRVLIATSTYPDPHSDPGVHTLFEWEESQQPDVSAAKRVCTSPVHDKDFSLSAPSGKLCAWFKNNTLIEAVAEHELDL